MGKSTLPYEWLKQKYEDGLNDDKIAKAAFEELGLSYKRRGIEKRRKTLRLVKQPVKIEFDRDLIYELYINQKMSANKIADQLQINRWSVDRFIRSQGWSRSRTESAQLRFHENPLSDINKNIPLENIAWAAGLFDGEGCVSLKRNRGNWAQPRISVGMTSKSAILKWQEIFQVGHISEQDRAQKNKKHMNLYRWQISSHDLVLDILLLIQPYLVAKREEVNAMIKLLQNHQIQKPYTKEDWELAQQFWQVAKITGGSRRKGWLDDSNTAT